MKRALTYPSHSGTVILSEAKDLLYALYPLEADKSRFFVAALLRMTFRKSLGGRISEQGRGASSPIFRRSTRRPRSSDRFRKILSSFVLFVSATGLRTDPPQCSVTGRRTDASSGAFGRVRPLANPSFGGTFVVRSPFLIWLRLCRARSSASLWLAPLATVDR